MPIRHHILLLTLATGARLAAAEAPPATPPKAEAEAAQPEVVTAESALKKAMSVKEVLEIMGKPASVQPLKEPSGKTEVWVYVRKINPRVKREQVNSTPIMVEVQEGNGVIKKHQTGENIQFADVHYYTEETVQLLMFNDHFVVCKISRRELKKLI